MKKPKKKPKKPRTTPGPKPPPTPVAHWKPDTFARCRVFTQAIADTICERMAAGETLNQICRADDMPGAQTVRNWIVKDPDGFGKQYDAAHDLLCEYWAADTIEISDDGTNDWMDREVRDGRTERTMDHEHIARSKLRVDTRKWLLSKLKRGKYGDSVDLNIGGQPNGAPLRSIATVTNDPVEAAKIYQQMMGSGTLPAELTQQPEPEPDAPWSEPEDA